jgi:hypothetical protein
MIRTDATGRTSLYIEEWHTCTFDTGWGVDQGVYFAYSPWGVYSQGQPLPAALIAAMKRMATAT